MPRLNQMHPLIVIALSVVVLFAPLLTIGGYGAWQEYTLHRDVTGHLKRAADANSVRLAKQELDTAIQGIRDRNLTEGETHILFPSPSQDLGFWFDNITSARQDLDKLDLEDDQLTTTNALMKLRETLLDENSITVPTNASVFPFVGIYHVFLTLSLLWTFGVAVFFGLTVD